MTKSLLIAGAGANQIGLYHKAREMGLVSIGVDGSSKAPGLPFASHSEVADIRSAEALLEIGRKHGIDGIYPAAELSVEACAEAAATLGLSGIAPEVATRVRNKFRMREALEKAGLPNPPFRGVRTSQELMDAASSFQFPIIVKPADANSSKGVQYVTSPETLEAAFSAALKYSLNGTVLFEGCLVGEEFCVDGLVHEGRYIPGGITGKRMSPLPYRYDEGIYMPPMKPQAYCEAIDRCAEAALRAVGFDNGTFHLEVIVTADGPTVVEIAGRPGGGRIPTDLIPMTYGMDFVADGFRIALGETPREKRRFERGSALFWFRAPAGVVRDIVGVDRARRLRGVREIVFQAKPGDTLGDTIDCVSRDQVGYVLTEGDAPQEAIEAADAALEACHVVMH